MSFFHCALTFSFPQGIVSIINLAVLSIQRLLIITDSDAYKITSYKTAFLIIFLTWLYSLCISVPPFFGFGAYVVESSGLT